MRRRADAPYQAAHRAGQGSVIAKLHRIGEGTVGADQSDREVGLEIESRVGGIAGQILALRGNAEVERLESRDTAAGAGRGPVALKKVPAPELSQEIRATRCTGLWLAIPACVIVMLLASFVKPEVLKPVG